MSEIRKVSVVGGGTMGNGIAHVCAQNGLHVTLVDVDQGALDAARATIARNMDRQVRKELLSEED